MLSTNYSREAKGGVLFIRVGIRLEIYISAIYQSRGHYRKKKPNDGDQHKRRGKKKCNSVFLLSILRLQIDCSVESKPQVLVATGSLLTVVLRCLAVGTMYRPKCLCIQTKCLSLQTKCLCVQTQMSLCTDPNIFVYRPKCFCVQTKCLYQSTTENCVQITYICVQTTYICIHAMHICVQTTTYHCEQTRCLRVYIY